MYMLRDVMLCKIYSIYNITLSTGILSNYLCYVLVQNAAEREIAALNESLQELKNEVKEQYKGSC